MTRKILIDGTPGVDEAIAISMALFHPDLELLAVTSIGGKVPAGTATRNLHRVIEFLDPPKYLRIGVGSETGPSPDVRHLWERPDFLEELDLPGIGRRALSPADRIICEAVRAAPHEITVVLCGPVTNLVRAFQRDPELPTLIRRVVIVGGTVTAPGDATPVASLNTFYDAIAARELFHASITRLMLPLDVTNRFLFSYAEDFEPVLQDESRIGRLLRWILPTAFAFQHEKFGSAMIRFPAVLAMMYVLAPHRFITRQMCGDVEAGEGLCHGMTVFDRREPPQWSRNIDVMTGFVPDEGGDPSGISGLRRLFRESLEASLLAAAE